MTLRRRLKITCLRPGIDCTASFAGSRVTVGWRPEVPARLKRMTYKKTVDISATRQAITH